MNEKKGNWTEKDLGALSKAISKFPSGTHQRWERIIKFLDHKFSKE